MEPRIAFTGCPDCITPAACWHAQQNASDAECAEGWRPIAECDKPTTPARHPRLSAVPTARAQGGLL
ncbi:MAG: hypothetical protein J0L58_09425 [Burkholderiales bacterium]|nr:hypothetical protein [Burkholderiales bacterium]